MSKVVVLNKKSIPPPPPYIEPPKPKPRKPSPVIQPPPEEIVEEGLTESSESEEDEYEPLPQIKTQECTKEDCKKCFKECYTCPYFPLCCNLPLLTALQFLILIDILVVIVTLAFWGYAHHFDPFQGPTGYVSRTQEKSTPPPDSSTVTPGGRQSGKSGESGRAGNDDRENDPHRFSKVGYLNLENLQNVEHRNHCGTAYYEDFLFGERLNETRGIFLRVVHMNYVSEFMELFIDFTFLITTCCFFSFTSARFYLIAIWHSELLPMGIKMWLFISTQSRTMCIFQYGIGLINKLPGLSLLRYLHIVPLMLFRGYKWLVFSYFIRYLFTFAGHLRHNTKVQGVTLREYKQRQKAYLQMTSNRDYTSSDDDDL